MNLEFCRQCSLKVKDKNGELCTLKFTQIRQDKNFTELGFHMWNISQIKNPTGETMYLEPSIFEAPKECPYVLEHLLK